LPQQSPRLKIIGTDKKISYRDDEVLRKDLTPNTTYKNQVTGFEYKTNDKGNPYLIFGEHVKVTKANRTRQGTSIGKLGKLGDVGGHPIAATLGADPDAYHIVPQDAKLNNTKYKKMENFLKKESVAGKDVSMLVAMDKYRGDRPYAFDVLYQINGVLGPVKRFINRAPRKT